MTLNGIAGVEAIPVCLGGALLYMLQAGRPEHQALKRLTAGKIIR